MKSQEPLQTKRPDFAEIARRSFEAYEGHARIDTIVRDDSVADDDLADGEESERPPEASDTDDLSAA